MNPQHTDLTPSLHDLHSDANTGGFGFADESPVQDADAFAHVGDELTDREIDAMFVADMDRRDREAAAAAKPCRLIRLSWVLRTDAPGKFGFDGRHDAFASMADAEAAFRDVARYPAGWYEVALQTSTDGLTWRSWEEDRAAGAA